MEINNTIYGQMITFALFVWFTMKFVWPALTTAMDERKQKIADGLAAAEKGHKTLADAKVEAQKALAEAREKSQDIIASAHKTAGEIVETAKHQAVKERDNIIASGEQQVAKATLAAKNQLRSEVASLAVKGASHLLGRECAFEDNDEAISKLCEELD